MLANQDKIARDSTQEAQNVTRACLGAERKGIKITAFPLLFFMDLRRVLVVRRLALFLLVKKLQQHLLTNLFKMKLF